jgi:hypothetical protein
MFLSQIREAMAGGGFGGSRRHARSVQVSADHIEFGVDIRTDRLDRADAHNSNQRNDETVFYGGRAGFIFPKTLEKGHFKHPEDPSF